MQSPSVVLGYLNNEKANGETFLKDEDGKGRWMRTGDEAVVRKSPKGNEHIFIVDRIKELIKVKVHHFRLRLLLDVLLIYEAGSSSRTSRTRSPSSHPPCSRRLRSHPSPRRRSRGSTQSLCCQIYFCRLGGE